MNIHFWQIASGLGVGAFIASLYFLVIKQFGRSRGDGIQTSQLSATATAIVAVLILLIFGGITVLALVLYAPKQESKTSQSAEELSRILGDRYSEMRRILDSDSKLSQDPAAFGALRNKVEQQLKSLEAALTLGDMTRVHDLTKALISTISSDEAKEVISPQALPALLTQCSQSTTIRSTSSVSSDDEQAHKGADDSPKTGASEKNSP